MLTEEMKKSIESIVDEAWEKMNSKAEDEVKKSDDEDDKKEDKKDKKKEMKKSDEETEEKVEKSEEAEGEEEADAEEESTEKSEASKEAKEEDIEKGTKSGEAPKEKTPENGGKDEMKSGTPHTEKQKMMKSLEELSEFLSEDEVELIAAWREDSTESAEDVAKSQSGLQDDKVDVAALVKSAITEATDEFKKSLSEKDEIIKSMNDKIEKMASRPAYDKRSVDSLEPIEKSGESNTEPLSKSQVLDTMLDLQKSGKGVGSLHISEFEATGNISDPRIKQQVMDACKKA